MKRMELLELEPRIPSMSDSDARRAHELSQLRRFRALSLRQKLEAVQGMADVVRRLNHIRREGKFRSGALGRRV